MRKLLMLLGVVAVPGAAQETPERVQVVFADEVPERSITVLASGIRAANRNSPSIAVFEFEDIEPLQGPDLTRLLERASGVAIARNGGLGAFTSLRVRGAEGEQLLVLIDGVRVADPAAPGAGFDLGNLLMGNIAKLELQRSSNSTIWGSQAIGGVLAVTTGGREGIRASAEYGAHDSFYGTAGANLSFGRADLALQVGRADTEGFSAAAAGTERDGFSQTQASGQAELALTDALSAFARARYADGRLEIDGFPAPAYALADTDEFQETRQVSGATGLALWTPSLEIRSAYSLADTERANFDPALGEAPSYTTDGTSERAELRGRATLAEPLDLYFGAEREWLRFQSSTDASRQTAIAGAYVQLEHDAGPLHLAAGLRRDHHRDFGGEWSFGADGYLQLSPHLRFTAAYGEGFKAPSLFQLHSNYGNAALDPERSQSYEAGLHAELRFADLRATAFRRDSRDLIAFVSCFGTGAGLCADRPFGTYGNIGRARAQGVELTFESRLPARIELSGNYTFLEAEDRTEGNPTFGNDLARRPRHAATLSASRPFSSVELAADLRIVGSSYDDAQNLVRLGGYAVLTARGEWNVHENVVLYARIENLLDEKYQTAAGYGTPGRGLHVGARAAF